MFSRPALLGSIVGALACTGLGQTVLNADFELSDGSALAGWLPDHTINYTIPNNVNGTGNGFTDYVWDTASAGGGNGSLLLRGKGIRPTETEKKLGDVLDRVISRKFQFKPETEYKLTLSYRAKGLVGKGAERCTANLTINFADGPYQPGYLARIGVITDRWNSKENIPGRVNDHHSTPSQRVIEIADNSDNWKTFEVNFKTSKNTTKGDLRLEAFCNTPAHPFSIWFDNIKIEPIAPADAFPPAETPKSWTPRTLPPSSDRGMHTGEPEPLAPAIPYGSRMQRTMRLLATSTPEHRNRVTILCYGQSIMAQKWSYKILGELQQRYPNADIVMENTSLGGFMSDNLIISAETDLYPVWPDLVLMHDYQPDGEYGHACTEYLYANLRARTTSEMLTYTHHNAFPGMYSSPAMFNQLAKGQDTSSASVRTLADKYGFEIVEARKNWEKITKELFPDLDFRFAINHFLTDQVHNSPRGQRLYHYLSMPHFAYRPEDKPTWLDMIRVYDAAGARWNSEKQEYPDAGKLIEAPLKLEFVGSRVDVITMPVSGKPGSAKILLDGKPPTSFASVYVSTRATSAAPISWPIIVRTGIGGHPVAEEWTLTFTKAELKNNDPLQPYWEYTVAGSVTGPDGAGNNRETFVSKSGRLTLKPDYFLKPQFTGPAKFLPAPGSEVKWKTVAIATDTLAPREGADPRREERYVLAQGLSNDRHVLEILPNGDGPVGVRAIVVHQPPAIQIPPEPVKPADNTVPPAPPAP